jgi:hypothetical protein
VNLRLLPQDVGHNAPTTTAIYTHLPVSAAALARDARPPRMADRYGPREGCSACTGGALPTLWPRLSRSMRRP